ncbi:hypothetical protein Hanom_Chr16g01512401 [Helianthus anomalus]
MSDISDTDFRIFQIRFRIQVFLNTHICTCVLVHHEWIIARTKPIFTFRVILKQGINGGGNVLFKQKQNKGLLNRAFMGGVDRRCGRRDEE